LSSCRVPSLDASKAFPFHRPRAGAPGLQVGRKRLLRAMYRYVFIPTARCAPCQGQRSSQTARVIRKTRSCALSTAFDPLCPRSPAHCDYAQGEPRRGQGPARWLQEGATDKTRRNLSTFLMQADISLACRSSWGLCLCVSPTGLNKLCGNSLSNAGCHCGWNQGSGCQA